jgi:hypothetical protein
MRGVSGKEKEKKKKKKRRRTKWLVLPLAEIVRQKFTSPTAVLHA